MVQKELEHQTVLQKRGAIGELPALDPDYHGRFITLYMHLVLVHRLS